MASHEKDHNEPDEFKSSLERYLLMNEKEKDVEIQKAVERLQRRIQEILYVLETEKPHDPKRDKK